MQPDRISAPAAHPIQGIDYSTPHFLELDNGLPVWYLNLGSQEVVKAEFVFQAGSAHHANPLVPSFTSSLLNEGTAKHSAAEIAEAIDQYGAFLEMDHDKDFASITLYTLKRYYAQTLPVVIEIIQEASLPESEWKILQANRIQKFRINLGKVSFLAGKAFQELVFQGSPYGAGFSEETYLSTQLQDLQQFRKAHYTLESAMVLLCGRIDDEICQITNSIIGGIQISAPNFHKELPQASPVKIENRVNFISKDDAIQSAIRIGRRLFDRRHADYFGMKVLSTLLGGYFGSRLMSNIREDKGYTYGIGSGVMAYETDGWFYISTEVGAEVTADALKEIYHEIAVLREELVSPEELSLVKNYMLGNLLKSFDGPFERMERFKGVHLYHLNDDYYARYSQAIRDCSPESIRSLANKWLQQDDLLELVVGKK